MQSPSPSQVLGFMLLPVHRRDFSAFIGQWRVFVRSMANVYIRLGLITGDIDAIVDRGMHHVLMGGWRGWRARWVPALAAGWRNGAGEGMEGRVGGAVEAVWAGRHEIVRDASAVAMGWTLWGAVWFWAAWMVVHGVVTTAQAAAPATGAQTDLARQVLGDLFTFLGSGTVLAQGLGQIAQVLSTAAATIGGLMIVWTIAIMMYEYTNSQEKFEQHYSWWMFFLRIAFVIPMLVPLAGGWDGGQRLAGAGAAWGSDKASAAWTATVTLLGSSNNWVTTPSLPEMDIQNVVAATVAAEACMAEVNLDPTRNQYEHVTAPGAGGGGYNYTLRDASLVLVTEAADGCGAVVFPTQSAQGAQTGAGTAAFLAVQQSAFTAMQGSVRSTITAMVTNHITCRDTPPSCGSDPDPSVSAGWVTAYRQAVQDGISNAVQTVNQQAAQFLPASAAANGWIGAASWAQSLTQFQSSIDGAATGLPRVKPPTIHGVKDSVQAALQMYSNGFVQSGTPMAQAQASFASGSSGALDDILKAVSPDLTTIMPQINTMSPMAGLATLGHWVYGTAIAMKTFTAIFAEENTGGSTAPSLAEKTVGKLANVAVDVAEKVVPYVGPAIKIATGAANGLKAIIDVAFIPMMVMGLALAHLVPALPFIRMLFGVLGWLIAFVEAMFLVPISLVLMISAEPGHFFTSGAKAGLWNVFGLIVRPILTVAGFIAGLMLITEVVGLLNKLMVPVMQNIAGGSFIFIGFFANIFIYLGLAYVIVNTSTKGAETLPNAAYRWIGANAGGERDDSSAVAGALGGAVAKVTSGLERRMSMGKGFMK